MSKTNENGVVVIHSEKTERGVLHINEEKKVLCVWKLGKGNSEKNTCRPFARFEKQQDLKGIWNFATEDLLHTKSILTLVQLWFFFQLLQVIFFLLSTINR